MSSDLEGRLRSAAYSLPEPDGQATDAARQAMHEARASAPWARGRRRSWFSSRGPRTYLLAAAVALLVAGGALAASHWSLADLPPFGDGDREAFVLPATEFLPGGYERTRPPRYADLPARPSLLFPAGVTYSQALKQYSAARAKGRILPTGVVLADPLPAGKVVLVSNGRVRLDPAAPLGYSATTGLVNVPYGPKAVVPPIARCQLLLGPNDPHSPQCDAPGKERTYVREGVNGRWIPSENQEALLDPLVPASTQLAVIDHPTTPIYRFSPRTAPRLIGPQKPRLSEARIALHTDRVTLVAVPATNGRFCLMALGNRGSTWTCGQRASMFGRGAVLLGMRPGGGRLRVSGFVGDGVTDVRANDGTIASVVHNAFTMVPGDSASRFTFSGPVGSFTVTPSREGPKGPPQSPDRSKERELVGIDLADGGRASIRVAPNRGGGLCQWLYIRGTPRSRGCADASTAIPYDLVSGGFSGGGPGYPFVYSGQFAPQVGAVEMNFADGTAELLPLTDGFVLYEIPEDRITSRSRWPIAVTTYDRKGVALVRNALADFAALVRQQRPGLNP